MPPFVLLISAAIKYEYSQVSMKLVVHSSEVSFHLTVKKSSEKSVKIPGSSKHFLKILVDFGSDHK